MEQASPARLFAAAVGLGLLAYGVVGFFFDSSFAAPADLRDAVGLLSVNGWANASHMLAGALGLLVAGFSSRAYALWLTAFYAAVAVFGTL